jgi:2-dehydropantoate 2-reductase
MRILVIGAGALGGYFGGRLLAAGRDVTFLVRARRAEELAKSGLVIRSPVGDASIPAPPTVTAEKLDRPFDLILLSCKAYDLEGAIQSFAPAVGPDTAILPVLNGLAHIDALSTRFGRQSVLGGQCLISATLDDAGRIVHLNDSHLLSFGELDGERSPRVEAIAATFNHGGFDPHLSTEILQEMWEKWVFIAAAAGATCLMRASFGDIVNAGAGEVSAGMFDECCAIAAANGHKPREAAVARSRAMFTSPTSPLMASMVRDIERGARIEADHVVGDLLRRGGKAADNYPLLKIALAHLKSYEVRRAREVESRT